MSLSLSPRLKSNNLSLPTFASLCGRILTSRLDVRDKLVLRAVRASPNAFHFKIVFFSINIHLNIINQSTQYLININDSSNYSQDPFFIPQRKERTLPSTRESCTAINLQKSVHTMSVLSV